MNSRTARETVNASEHDRFREQRNAVKEMGKFFKVDVKEKLCAMEEEIAKLEDLSSCDYIRRGREEETETCSDGEIESMFRSL